MKSLFRALVCLQSLPAVLGLMLLTAGCATSGSSTQTGVPPEHRKPGEARLASVGAAPVQAGSSDVLRPGDFVSITFSGLSDPPPKHEERIKEDGTITLTYLGPVQAAGKTRTQLEQTIEAAYVPKIYRRLTVRVAPEGRFFYVYGEVNNPNRHPYQGEMTVLRAIAASGDFTNFANKKNVELTRPDGSKYRIDCIRAQKNTALDLPVYPEDVILIKRRWF